MQQVLTSPSMVACTWGKGATATHGFDKTRLVRVFFMLTEFYVSTI